MFNVEKYNRNMLAKGCYISSLFLAALELSLSNVCDIKMVVVGLQIANRDGFKRTISQNSYVISRNVGTMKATDTLVTESNMQDHDKTGSESRTYRAWNPYKEVEIADKVQSVAHCDELYVRLLSEYNDEVRTLESEDWEGKEDKRLYAGLKKGKGGRVHYTFMNQGDWAAVRIPMSKMAPILDCYASSRAYMFPTDGGMAEFDRGAPSTEEFFKKAATKLEKMSPSEGKEFPSEQEKTRFYLDTVMNNLSFYTLSEFRDALRRLLKLAYNEAIESGKRRILISVPYYNFYGGGSTRGGGFLGSWSKDLLYKSNLWVTAHAYQILKSNKMFKTDNSADNGAKDQMDFEFVFYGENNYPIMNVFANEAENKDTQIWNLLDASYSGIELAKTIDRFRSETEKNTLDVRYLVPIAGKDTLSSEALSRHPKSYVNRHVLILAEHVANAKLFFVQWKAADGADVCGADGESTGDYHELGQAILPDETPYNQDHNALAINNLSEQDYVDYANHHPSQAVWHYDGPDNTSITTQDEISNSNVSQQKLIRDAAIVNKSTNTSSQKQQSDVNTSQKQPQIIDSNNNCQRQMQKETSLPQKKNAKSNSSTSQNNIVRNSDASQQQLNDDHGTEGNAGSTDSDECENNSDECSCDRHCGTSTEIGCTCCCS